MGKKVLIISSNAGSLVNFHLNLLKTFIESGYSVVACAPLPTKSDLVETLEKVSGIRFVPIKLKNTSVNVFYDVATIINLASVIRNEKPDVVLSRAIKPVIYGSIASKIVGIKSIYSMVSGLGYLFIGDTYKVKIMRFIAEKLYALAFIFNNKVFFQNIDDLNLFSDAKIIDKSKAILVNGSGVDVDHYVPLPYPKTCAFLFVGRLMIDKGIREYIEAARIIKREYPGVQFKIAGDCDYNPASLSKKELTQIVDDGIVEYLGFLDNIKSAISDSSVFVLPSYREGTSHAALEAMASGRPIITTNAPGCSDTVQNGINGYLVPVKRVDELVNAMKRFVLNPDSIEIMGKESRRMAEDKYDVRKVNQVILGGMNIFNSDDEGSS